MSIKIIVVTIILLLIGGVAWLMVANNDAPQESAIEGINNPQSDTEEGPDTSVDVGVLANGQVLYVALPSQVPSSFCNEEENYFNCLRGSSVGRLEPRGYLNDAQSLNFLECFPEAGKDLASSDLVRCDGFYQEDFLYDSDGTNIIQNEEEVIVYSCDFLIEEVEFLPRVDQFEDHFLKVKIKNPSCVEFLIHNAS